MKKPSTVMVAIQVLVCGVAMLSSGVVAAQVRPAASSTAQGPLPIADRRELFIDDFLVETLVGVEFRLHPPTPREIVLVKDAPWEGAAGAAITVFRDGDRFRMYYDTFLSINEDGTNIRVFDNFFLCYAESRDGIHWTKPELGLVAFDGSKKNNILLPGNWDTSVFKDPNPACRPGEEYKMLQGVMGKGLFAYKSSDGLAWSPLGEEPIIAQKPGIPMFDTQNLAFWDPLRKQYWTYFRGYNDGRRDIFVATSADFRTWTQGDWVEYPDSPRPDKEQLYTSQILPCPRAPHIFVGFPTRYVERGWSRSFDSLPDPVHRKNRMNMGQERLGNGEPRLGTAITDGLFMTSRDGRTFRRWDEPFLRPGIERKTNWVYGDCYQNWGLVETASSDPFAPPEYSLYVCENYWRRPIQVRRYTLRIDGFASLHASAKKGEVVTKPLLFAGQALTLNFATSAAGNVLIELQDAAGKPIPGYTLNDCDDLFGDTLERIVTWNGKPDVTPLAGKPVRMRMSLKDADVYSFQFVAK